MSQGGLNSVAAKTFVWLWKSFSMKMVVGLMEGGTLSLLLRIVMIYQECLLFQNGILIGRFGQHVKSKVDNMTLLICDLVDRIYMEWTSLGYTNLED